MMDIMMVSTWTMTEIRQAPPSDHAPATSNKGESIPIARATSAQQLSHIHAGHRQQSARLICTPSHQGRLQQQALIGHGSTSGSAQMQLQYSPFGCHISEVNRQVGGELG